ncbi:hypothetical protein EK21DRAFT_105448 [Setomelanomma holmii]|uniref:Uncharacterized protein n=1 Tax=Setomelanomma holmii TaxID=210430 RepID=A0A9P4LGH2_9PLEO|nr:hypothetical protein EK21DRAFT_105448 [Setomelanomma holmii]
MSGAPSPSAFWSQKSREVKTALPTISAEPAKSPTVVSASKTGLTNGAVAKSLPTTTRWSDFDDDEEFLAGCLSLTIKSPAATTKSNVGEQKSTHTDTLGGVGDAKDVRIHQLEDIVQEKQDRMAMLEEQVEDNEVSLETLKEDNHKQYLYIQEMVAEVDEKSRRILDLETELDDKGARIRELEMGTVSESHTQVSTDDVASPVKEYTSDPVPDSDSTDTTNTDLPKTAEKTDVSECSTPCESSSEHVQVSSANTGDLQQKHDSQQAMGVPAVNESKFPKLWSPDLRPKNSAPVEKPRLLKMAIDTSKFGKYPAATAVKKPEPTGRKGVSTTSYGQTSKGLAKTGAMPKIDPERDIRQLPHAERVLFANGPEVVVNSGSMKLATVSKFVLMQCSAIANEHFTQNPGETSIAFPQGSMNPEAAKKHLSWMQEMTYQGRVYSVTLNAEERHDTKNLKICQAARVMGLNNTYVGHFTKVLCDRVRSNKYSLEFISTVCELAYPSNDPIFDCLANNLVNRQLSKSFTNADELEKLLVSYPVLKESMAKIEQRVKDSRAADRRKGSMFCEISTVRGESK